MKLSWDIQKKKQTLTRAKALSTAWAILNNEEITLRYMARYVSHKRNFGLQIYNQLGLFND
jgi:hypothetical protein